MAEINVEELQTKLTALENALKEKESKITELNSALDTDRKDLIRKRDEAKESERKSLEENEKFQQLYLNTKKDLEEYKTQFSADKYSTMEKQINDMIKAQKDRLMSAIPEEDRELFEDMPIEKLEKLVTKLGQSTVGVDNGTGRTQTSTGTKKWADMGDKERIDLANSDPKKAKELMKVFFADKKK
jgi:hypothetical protein